MTLTSVSNGEIGAVSFFCKADDEIDNIFVSFCGIIVFFWGADNDELLVVAIRSVSRSGESFDEMGTRCGRLIDKFP